MSDWRPEAGDFLRQNEDRFVRQATRCCWLHKVPHLVEDVLSDAIEKLLENWPNKLVAADENFRCMHMFVIIRLLTQNAGARADTERKYHSLCLDDPGASQSATNGVSAEDIVMGIAAREQLYTAIRGLPTRQREVIELGKLGELSCNEIAYVLKISTSAVTTSMKKAMDKLRAAVPPDLIGDLETTHSIFMLNERGRWGA